MGEDTEYTAPMPLHGLLMWAASEPATIRTSVTKQPIFCVAHMNGRHAVVADW